MVTFILTIDDERLKAITSPAFAVNSVENMMTAVMFSSIVKRIEKGEMSDVVILDEILEDGHEDVAGKLALAISAAVASIDSHSNKTE